MEEQPLDPDLQNLMNELGKVEGETPKPPEPKAEEPKVAEVVDVKVTDTKVEEPKQEIKDAVLADSSVIDDGRARIQGRLIGLIDTHCDSAIRIIEDVESDRKKCDDVYNILFAKLQNNDYRASDAAAIVATLQTKADITKTRANMMDSVAKLLGSLKNNSTVQTDNGGGSGDLSSEEIKALLDRKE